MPTNAEVGQINASQPGALGLYIDLVSKTFLVLRFRFSTNENGYAVAGGMLDSCLRRA